MFFFILYHSIYVYLKLFVDLLFYITNQTSMFPSIEHPEITLGSVHDYGLCIAEDDGEVDWAFPCLDANEPCSKFGFTCLGLVDLKSKHYFTHAPISIPEDGMLEVFPKAAESGHSQHNPSRHNTGGSATSEAVRKAINAVNEGKHYGYITCQFLNSTNLTLIQ